MAPRHKKVADNPNSWWDSAYSQRPDIEVAFEYEFGKDTLVPGTKIRIKHKRGEYKFRCFATNVKTGKSWIDVIEIGHAFRSYRPEAIRCVVKPKKARRKRTK